MSLVIRGELEVVEDGVVRVSSFSREHLIFYMGLREAGLSHADAGARLRFVYGHGGGPRPRTYYEDEIELTEVSSPESELDDEEDES